MWSGSSSVCTSFFGSISAASPARHGIPYCVFTQSRYAGLDDVDGPSIEAVFESNWNGPEPRMMSQEICNLVCGYLLSPKNAALIPARMTRNRSC